MPQEGERRGRKREEGGLHVGYETSSGWREEWAGGMVTIMI